MIQSLLMAKDDDHMIQKTLNDMMAAGKIASSEKSAAQYSLYCAKHASGLHSNRSKTPRSLVGNQAEDGWLFASRLSRIGAIASRRIDDEEFFMEIQAASPGNCMWQ